LVIRHQTHIEVEAISSARLASSMSCKRKSGRPFEGSPALRCDMGDDCGGGDASPRFDRRESFDQPAIFSIVRFW
jgi:hypothetical protein